MPKTDCADVFKHEIIRKYFDTVYRLALSRTNNKDWAEDVLQDVFLKYIESNKVFQDEEHIKAWLITVTVNCTKRLFRAPWNVRHVPITEDIVFETPEGNDVYSAVARLPAKYRTVIHLFYYEDMSVKQIARCLGMKENTVKSNLHRARSMLKPLLGGREDYEF